MLEPLYRWLAFRRTCQILRSKSDRVLADIGVERENIAEFVRSRTIESPIHGRTRLESWIDQASLSLSAYLQRRALEKRVRRELSSYRDSELDDIGISRHDIPAIVRQSGLASAV